MFGGVLVVAIVGAIIARFQPYGMALAMFATALAQGLVAAIAAIAGMGQPASPPLEILGVSGFFVALWLLSAWLARPQANRLNIRPPRREIRGGSSMQQCAA